MTLLRISIFVAAAAGTMCLGLQGQLRMPFMVLALLAELAAAAAPHLLPGKGGMNARRRMSNVSVLAVLGVMVWLVIAGRSGVDLTDAAGLVIQIGRVIAVPLVAVLVGQLASADSLRELRMVLVASLLCVLLALGTAEGGAVRDLWSALGASLALGWAAALVSLWLLHRAKFRQGATLAHLGRLDGGRPPGGLVVGSLLIGVATFILLPHPTGWHPPGWEGQSASSNGSVNAGRNLAATPRAPGTYLSDRLDLNSRGDLPATRLVSVPAQSPPLWAGSVLSRYQGRFWTPGSYVSGAVTIPVDSAGDYDLRPAARPGQQPADADRTDPVRVLGPELRLPLIAPGQAVSVRIDGRIGRRSAAVTSIGSDPMSYEVRSTSQISSPTTAEDLQLPSSLPARVGELAQEITRGARTPEAKVAAIEAYLRSHERYRLDSPVPDVGRDPVDDFLFESHEGFCEHFAAAEAVLLRSVGVPTRLVTGFSTGVRDGTQRVFRGSDAHAWVQVHVGDGRWVFSDPTAGATLAPERTSWVRDLAALVVDHWRLALGLTVSVLVLVLFSLVVVRRLFARRARRRILAAPAQDQVLAAFARLETALFCIGLDRAPQSSVHELTWSLLGRWPGGLRNQDEVRATMLVVERVLYDSSPVSAAEALDAVTTLDQLAEQARGPQFSAALT